jgi:predicted kinase
VIVSGPPASGKTTLVRRLAPALGLFVLAKDDIKETLGEKLPPKSLSDSQALGTATLHLMFHLARGLIESGVSLALEGNFYRGYAEEEIGPLMSRGRGVLVHCAAKRDVCVRRYQRRIERGDRHPVHFDREHSWYAGLTDESWDRLYTPLDLEIPTLVVDTTHRYVDDIEPIVAFIRSAASGSVEASRSRFEPGAHPSLSAGL